MLLHRLPSLISQKIWICKMTRVSVPLQFSTQNSSIEKQLGGTGKQLGGTGK